MHFNGCNVSVMLIDYAKYKAVDNIFCEKGEWLVSDYSVSKWAHPCSTV